MSMSRLLPLVGVAVGGVLAMKVAAGVTDFPDMLQGAKAFAEGAAKAAQPAVKAVAAKAGAAGQSPKPVDPNAPPLPPGLSPTQAAAAGDAGVNAAAQARPRLACAPSASDLAHEAGLSPSELQVLQSLGARRGQLDQREADLQVQLQLLAAAETKVDAKLKALGNMKADLQKMLDAADQKSSAELDRLVTVYSAMRPKDAAARMSLLDDAVRIPIAAKMKERNLSAILGQMSPADAKAITEKLARRFQSQALNDAKAAVNGTAPQPQAAAAPAQAAAAAPADTAAAAPAPAPAKPQKLARRPRLRGKARPTKLAAAAVAPAPAGAKPAPAAQAGAAAGAPATPTAQAAKAG